MYVEFFKKNAIYCDGAYDFIVLASKRKDLFLGVKRFLCKFDILQDRRADILSAKTPQKIIEILESKGLDLNDLDLSDFELIKEMVMLADKAYTIEIQENEIFRVYEVSSVNFENESLETELEIDTILNMV